jgi:hypothetical protein
MAIENPHWYSTTTGVTTTTQITDDVDYPHTGLIKSLSQGIRGNYAIKGSATDFDITFADGGSFTTIAVTTGKAYRDGKLVTITALTATNMNTSYNSGTGAVDITPVTDDFYLMLVAKSDNTMVLRGSNAVTNRIPDFVEGDIPIAIIKVVGGSADDSAATSDRLVQFLTTSKVSNDLSIGYDDSGYTEALQISASAGHTTIENKVPDKDIIFKVDDGGVTTEVMRIDGSKSFVSIGGVTDANAMLHLKSSTSAQPELRLENTNTDSQEATIRFMKNTASPAASDDLGLIRFEGEDSGGTNTLYSLIMSQMVDPTNGQEAGEIFLNVKHKGETNTVQGIAVSGHATGNGEVVINDSGRSDFNFRVESDNEQFMLFVDAADDRVSIGHGSPAATLDVETGGTFRNTRLLTVSVSANTTLTEAANAGRYNICAGNVVLPSTSTAGEHYAILNTTGGDITIGRNSRNINGAGSDVTLGTFKAATCIAIGSNNWMVIGV